MGTLRQFTRLANDAINRLECNYGRKRLLSHPVEVILEPTNRCNSRCLMCKPYRRAPEIDAPESGFMSWEILHRSLPLLRLARRALLSGFGEPLLHPEFTDIARWVRERVPYTYFFTNGSLITAQVAEQLVLAPVDSVVFSFGGATDATFQRVRGMKLESTLNGLAHLDAAKAELKSTLPAISFNVVQMNSVLPELPGIVDIAKHFGVPSISLPQMWVESAAVRNESVLTNPAARQLLEECSVYAKRAGVEIVMPELSPSPARCSAPWTTMYVAYNGHCYSCSAERYGMGTIATENPLALWRSSGFRDLRHLLAHDPQAICPNCPQIVGTAESYLNPARHGRTVCSDFADESRPVVVDRKRIIPEES